MSIRSAIRPAIPTIVTPRGPWFKAGKRFRSRHPSAAHAGGSRQESKENSMKFAFAMLISACLLSAPDPQQNKQPAQPPAKLIKPLTVPPGAVEHETGRFYYTDPQGKKWIYTKTPFGVSRMEDKP